MLPDMSDVLDEWLQTVTLKTVTQGVDGEFNPVPVITSEPLRAVIQVAKPETLNPDTVDWSLRYITAHSKTQTVSGQYIEFQGTDYKIVDHKQWGQYGYYKSICEEVKGAIR